MYNHLCSSLVATAINYVEITKFPSNIRAPSRTDVPVCIAELKSTMGQTGVGGAVVGNGLDPPCGRVMAGSTGRGEMAIMGQQWGVGCSWWQRVGSTL